MMSRHDDDMVSIARNVAMREGFVVEAPAEVMHSIRTLIEQPDDGDRSVVDERGLPWTSIDNRESTDLDQVEASVRRDDGSIEVKIGIADVDIYVPKGSAGDRYAASNTTSLYAGVATFPMLPDELSSDASSLLEGRSRLAVVTAMTIAKDGSITDSRVYRARLENRAKLVYGEVGAWLEGRGPEPSDIERAPELGDQVRMQDEAAQRLRRRRIEHGALQLSTIEARAVAKNGEVVALEITDKNRGRELIEDMMIAANGVTARFLEERGFASIRRVVRTPKRWDRIVDLARELGTKLPAEPSAVALSDFLKDRREADPKRFVDLSISVVKLLGPGEYAVADPKAPDGHFALAASDYAHSTAPNRRYGDLVTQRLLKAAAAGKPSPYTVDELWSIARRCTEMEDHARKFERTMRKVAAALFLSKRIGDEFDAVCTGVNPNGTFVRLEDPPAEGRVVEGEEGIDVGDTLRVRLVATEPRRGFIDFVRV
ncbi:MAG: RNB domain-containing ribonuclease [Deltaproteobacteria bacterium]|nr:RNB domain-containing ribonuclease [Deltaproteobacteria bacterium]